MLRFHVPVEQSEFRPEFGGIQEIILCRILNAFNDNVRIVKINVVLFVSSV